MFVQNSEKNRQENEKVEQNQEKYKQEIVLTDIPHFSLDYDS